MCVQTLSDVMGFLLNVPPITNADDNINQT